MLLGLRALRFLQAGRQRGLTAGQLVTLVTLSHKGATNQQKESAPQPGSPGAAAPSCGVAEGIIAQ